MGVYGNRTLKKKEIKTIPFKKTGILTTCSVHDVEKMLADYYGIRQNLVVPNVAWGFWEHEADLVVVTASGYLTEIEIKRSWTDFLADFQKECYHDDQRIDKLYYAVPECMLEPCKKYLDSADAQARFGIHGEGPIRHVQPGIIIYRSPDEAKFRRISVQMEPSMGGRGRKLTDKEIVKLSRLGCLRYWSLLDKLRVAEAKNEQVTKEVARDQEVLRLKNLLTEIKADYRAIVGTPWELENY